MQQDEQNDQKAAEPVDVDALDLGPPLSVGGSDARDDGVPADGDVASDDGLYDYDWEDPRDGGMDAGGACDEAGTGPAVLRVGARVEAFGLTGASELNGLRGEVVTEQGERFGVRFDEHTAGEKSLRPRNLRLLSATLNRMLFDDSAEAPTRPASPSCPTATPHRAGAAADRRRRRGGAGAAAAAATSSGVASAPSQPTPPARRQRREAERPTNKASQSSDV